MSFGVTELIIIAVIVLLLFGTTKLKSLGSDLGSAIKGFRTAMDRDQDEDKPKLEADEPNPIPDASEKVEAKKES
ncbi:MAG: twin-arginine translocase TatA/TatE family subunit [Gammaproteobacteria bacterium]|jgi:sec-independent protein translocase protein TatA|nr:twin-arginine translocase TatA/TatE family subunit [Gammaproteobacteria bacterium]|tara:strand:- start:349 stop:573 length:225 start_codon:yes stop_codon:yes gene_type:complete